MTSSRLLKRLIIAEALGQGSSIAAVARHLGASRSRVSRMANSPAAVYADLIVPAKTGEFWRAPKNSPMGFPRCTVICI